MSDRLEQLHKLRDADPADADVPYMIAMELLKEDEKEQALHWLDETLKVQPNYHYAFYQKGKLLGELGRRDEAIEVLEAGLQQATEDGNEKARSELATLLDMVK